MVNKWYTFRLKCGLLFIEIYNYSEGKFNEVLSAFKKLNLNENLSNDLLFNVSQSYYKLKKYADTITVSNILLKRENLAKELKFVTLISRGNSLFELEDFKSAKIDYFDAFKINSNSQIAIKNLGDASLRLKDYTSAVTFYKNALYFEENLDDILKNMSYAYIYLKEYDKAISNLESIKKKDTDVYYSLAICYHLSKKTSKVAPNLLKAKWDPLDVMLKFEDEIIVTELLDLDFKHKKSIWYFAKKLKESGHLDINAKNG